MPTIRDFIAAHRIEMSSERADGNPNMDPDARRWIIGVARSGAARSE